MKEVVQLLLDNNSIPGKLTTSMAAVALALVVAALAGRAATRRVDDPYSSYYLRKLVRYGVAVATLVLLAIVWRAFAGRVGVSPSRCRRWLGGGWLGQHPVGADLPGGGPHRDGRCARRRDRHHAAAHEDHGNG